MIIGWIAKIVAGLYSNRKPGEVAAAISLAVLLALIPANNLMWYVLLVAMFFFSVNQAIALVFIAILSPLSFVVDPLLHRIGFAVLTTEVLQNGFSWLYTVPLLPFTRFNNTLVMGGLVAGLTVSIPVFFAARAGVMTVRLRVIPKLAASKPVQTILKVPLVSKFAAAGRRWHTVYQAVR